MTMNERERQDTLVTSALQSVGERCDSIYDYVNGKTFRDERSINVLISLLPIVTDYRIKEGIVRALNDPIARGKAEKPLIREFKNLPNDESSETLRWAIGATLGSLDLRVVTADVLEIVSDTRFGFTRQMMIHDLNKLHDDRVIPILINLLQDESVRGHAIQALRKARAQSAIDHIQLYTTDKNPWIRRTAKTAVAALRKLKK
jgi:HEAT repeat protein